MPFAKLGVSDSLGAMKSEEGNDSLDTIIRQAIGKEPFLSFPRTGDSTVQWIQLLHALDQQDLPGWPLLTPLKIQMQKCDKCSREFCSPINCRRHIRVHRRSLNIDKESHKNRDLLGAFWDKLSVDEAKEIVSFTDVNLEEVPGSSITRALTSFIRKPGFCALPQVCVKAGSALLDIIQARPSRLPISSQELFSILDDASERTFLCAGTAESVQKYVFDGEAGKIGLEMKNLVACTSFLLEQKLVKAWLADKDAEALRCQKLLVEEEEAARKRQAELLERKRLKKLRQKEQKAKEQPKADLIVTPDVLESPPSTETSCFPAQLEYDSYGQSSVEIVSPRLGGVKFSNNEEEDDSEILVRFSSENSDWSTGQNAELRTVQGNGCRHLVTNRWQVPKSQWVGRNGFHASQHAQVLKLEPSQKHEPHGDTRAAPVNGSKVWTRKPKAEIDGERVRSTLQQETMNQTDQNKCEVMIGSITVTVRNCSGQQQCHGPIEAQGNCSSVRAITKKNDVKEKLMNSDGVHCSTNQSTIKLWRPVSRLETNGQSPVHSGNQESVEDLIFGKSDNGAVPSETSLQSCVMDENDSDNPNNSHPLFEEIEQPEGLPFSSHVAKVFLAQRWKEAISGDHVKLVLLSEPEPPGYPNAQYTCRVAAPESDFYECSIFHSAENRLANVGAFESSTTGNSEAKNKA